MDTLSSLLLRVAVTRKLNSWDVTNYNILKHTGRRVGAVGLGREGWKEGWSCVTGKGRWEGGGLGREGK